MEYRVIVHLEDVPPRLHQRLRRHGSHDNHALYGREFDGLASALLGFFRSAVLSDLVRPRQIVVEHHGVGQYQRRHAPRLHVGFLVESLRDDGLDVFVQPAYHVPYALRTVAQYPDVFGHVFSRHGHELRGERDVGQAPLEPPVGRIAFRLVHGVPEGALRAQRVPHGARLQFAHALGNPDRDDGPYLRAALFVEFTEPALRVLVDGLARLELVFYDDRQGAGLAQYYIGPAAGQRAGLLRVGRPRGAHVFYHFGHGHVESALDLAHAGRRGGRYFTASF